MLVNIMKNILHALVTCYVNEYNEVDVIYMLI